MIDTVPVSTGVCDRCRGFLFSGGFVIEELPMDWDGYARGQRLALCQACFTEADDAVTAAKNEPCVICGTCKCNHGTDPISAMHTFKGA